MNLRHVFFNGNLFTADPRLPMAQALVTDGDRILFVGSNAEVLNGKQAGDVLVDLAGRSLLPGLNDSHLHFIGLGMALQAVNLIGSNSIEEIKEKVREHVLTARDGDWITGRGWDQNRFIEGRYPNRHDLDEVAPHHPVVLYRTCGHLLVANTKAMQMAGLTSQTNDVDGGGIDREVDGFPTGVLRERAMGLVRHAIPDVDAHARRRAVDLAAAHAVTTGITSVQANDGGGDWRSVWEAYEQALKQDRLPVRVNLQFSLSADRLLTDRHALFEANQTVTGDRLRFSVVKIMADGSLGARTAAFAKPYSDDPDNSGMAYHSQEAMDYLVNTVHSLGYQVAIHAIGDRTADQAITAIERAQGTRNDRRHRLVHCQVLDPQLIGRMARAGIVAEIQPKFVTTDLHWAGSRIGSSRLRFAYAWKTLLDFGVACSGGSDCPVEPIDPLLGIYAAVNRTDLDGQPEQGWLPDEKLSVSEAIELFTVGAAYAEHQEQTKGRLQRGHKADLVVLSGDIMATDSTAIKDLKVDLTMTGGMIVHQR